MKKYFFGNYIQVGTKLPKICYILVCSSVKNPLNEIHMIAAKNACKPIQRFGLGVKYGKFCKTIETLTVDEFKAKYSAYV